MTTENPPAQPKCTLEPMNLHDQAQADELLRQRKVCGWADKPEDITKWRDKMEGNNRTVSLFWIRPTSQPGLRVGHISLDSEARVPDLELANPHDKSVLTIANLFILPEHRRGGIGRAAVQTLEKWATIEPYGSRNCKTIALTAVSRKYTDDDEWRAEYLRMAGVEPPKPGFSNEEWYSRMGYTKWKDERLYPGPDGYKFLASFLRKRIA
ncbi:hypothetical protein VP1G_02776 [Cytospora mali]|uniref:N-acetyltransferase domain-containing protein n=1 Tax=Cytospora mali TaxID=578113 RepID=A0A194UV16_CYTMA|nr:hypothetical protein VP1G_02776 [Valsa mali var. pyri (nom. inval.)]